MEKRLLLFALLSVATLIANFFLQAWWNPPVKRNLAKPNAVGPAQPGGKEKAAGGKEPEKTPAQPEADKGDTVSKNPVEGNATPDQKPVPQAVVAAPAQAQEWITLGSIAPDSPYRMLVTLTNAGAAIERVELNGPRYLDIDDLSGYLGQLSPTDAPKNGGCQIHVVGPGTPAELAGLKPEDILTKLDDQPLKTAAGFVTAMEHTIPNQKIQLTVVRDGEPLPQPVAVTLVRKPLGIIRPEKFTKPLEAPDAGAHDPYSLLLTLEQVGNDSLLMKEAEVKADRKNQKAGEVPLPLPDELPSLHLRSMNWEIVSRGQPNAEGLPEAAFRCQIPQQHLEVVKRFRLAKVPNEQLTNEDFNAYHMVVSIEVHNTAAAEEKPQTVAFRLDGPNGLPLEGAWYTRKKGIRDVVQQFDKLSYTSLKCSSVVQNKIDSSGKDQKLEYMAVDAQYFAAGLMSRGKEKFALGETTPLFVGDLPTENRNYRGNTSFRIISTPKVLASGETWQEEFTLFTVPKKQEILEKYSAQESGAPNLSPLIGFGWFGFVSRIMLGLLHLFYSIIPNYGVAIVLLTLLVRACMFPISRKQALGAQKMQLIQPELKRLKEKFKNDNHGMMRAQSELFKKHGYHQLAGCLPLFLQMPIFIGLYGGLQADIALRQAPLFGSAVHWCSNLAAPDMLFNWTSFMPEMLSRESGMFSLGPFFNFFPCITISLFMLQQKLFMPPAVDEQSAMQQSMMKYMMIFMGFTFYCVPSGLCLYFIVSTSWGIMERKILPRTVAQPASEATVNAAPSKKKR